MMKRIVLCADDYGQASAISQGILVLVQNGRLSATSCMTNTPHWLEHAKWLRPFQNYVDVGLHFNLTEGRALSKAFTAQYGESLFSLPHLMQKSFLRQLDQKVIMAECEAQLESFAAGLGRLPDFIDGHQHVHQFPIIRDAVIQVFKKRLDPVSAYIRLVNEKVSWKDYLFNPKRVIIHFAGAKAFQKLLVRQSIPHNLTFAGIYSFSPAERYETLFLQFLSEIGDKGLIMCHPAYASTDRLDAIAESRWKEFQYIMGHEFLSDCHTHGIKLTRFGNLQKESQPAQVAL